MNKIENATFAGGCFWHMQSAFKSVPGVLHVTAGYTGGSAKNPTYEEVSSGKTGHYESIDVEFDSSKVTYDELLDFFWDTIDPTDSEGQHADRGSQYMTAIFYRDAKQKKVAEQSKKDLEKTIKKKVATKIIKFGNFYKAEEYHQDYFEKRSLGCRIFGSCTSKKNENKLNKLTAVQFNVTQKNGTEPPFDNAYWDNKKDGIYVDVVSGEPLFSSLDKFDSKTGWPSFSRPLESGNVIEKSEGFMGRIEVRSVHGNSHLGHVFNDGPKPSGRRYCMNSAALRFIPRESLKKEGYEKYEKLFNKQKKRA